MAPVVHTLEDLLLVGDFDAAIELTAVVHERSHRRDRPRNGGSTR